MSFKTLFGGIGELLDADWSDIFAKIDFILVKLESLFAGNEE